MQPTYEEYREAQREQEIYDRIAEAMRMMQELGMFLDGISLIDRTHSEWFKKTDEALKSVFYSTKEEFRVVAEAESMTNNLADLFGTLIENLEG